MEVTSSFYKNMLENKPLFSYNKKEFKTVMLNYTI